jgi:uncharacterized protein YndB with AHSA1/START domain
MWRELIIGNVNRFTVCRTGTIDAPPERVYAVLADYRQHHPRIVPPEYFRSIEVLSGGVGAGTRTRVTMQILGKTRTFEHVISEPEPGRVLREADPDGTDATTFTVTPGAVSGTTHLTIATEIAPRPGIGGLLERLFTPLLLKRIYGKEIDRIAAYVAGEFIPP